MAAKKTTKPKETTTTTVTTITKTTTTGGTSKKKSNNNFSWSRLLGITGIKQKISRKTGIPFSKSGRDRKIGSMVTKGLTGLFNKGTEKAGCVVYFFIPFIVAVGIYIYYM